MQSITFTCEIVSPMFMGGANPRQRTELRSPSLKGALRFWWRAMKAQPDIPELLQASQAIFGGVHQTVLKSRVQLRVMTPVKAVQASGPHWKHDENLNYLWYTVMGRNQKAHLREGSPFKIQMRMDPRLTPTQVEEVLQAFALCTLFGGLGARSRRGAGSFRIRAIKCQDEELKTPAETILGPFLHITDQADLLQKLDSFWQGLPDPGSAGSYSNLAGASFYLYPARESWIKALTSLGQLYEQYRKSLSIREKSLKESPNCVDVAHLGLPTGNRAVHVGIPGYDRQGKPILKAKVPRRASPLVFSVLQGTGNQYYPSLLHLGGDIYAPNKDMVYLRRDQAPEVRKKPDSNFLPAFIQDHLPAAIIHLS